MTFQQRQKDPTLLPVQLNVKVTWQLREDMVAIAKRKGVSMAQLSRDAIVKGLRDELTELSRERTAEAGATK